MYTGTNNKERKNLEKMKIHAKKFSEKIKKDVIIYEITETGQGTYFQYKEDEGEKEVKARIKYIGEDTSKNVLQNNGDGRSETAKPEKKESKPKKPRKNVAKS